LGTNFNDLTDAALDEAIKQIANLEINYDKLREEDAKKA
jgi:hypothetical protein